MTMPEVELIGQKLIRETLEDALDMPIEEWDIEAIKDEIKKFREIYKSSKDNSNYNYFSNDDSKSRQIAYALT